MNNPKSKIQNPEFFEESKIQNPKSLIKDDILEYLKRHEHKELLRFITCGSVDDGKSTLIGRLLYESKMVFEDHLMALKAEAKYKRTEDEIDFSLLVDGLQAEREQGITIDVAYRYFSTDKRKFIIADTPGHEQYTRNMATGASNADVAVILIDARNGVLTQTRRHSFIVTLMGIKHLVVTINKMDLVGYSEDIYEKIVRNYKEMFESLRYSLPFKKFDAEIEFIPISALKGDNVVKPSKNMPWYKGKTLLEYLNNISVNSEKVNGEHKNGSSLFTPHLSPFRFPVQFVNRPNLDFRGYCGTIASGEISVGDEIVVYPSRTKTKIKNIILPDYKENNLTPNIQRLAPFENNYSNSKIQNPKSAFATMSITIQTETEVDISRGSLIVKADDKQPKFGSSFEAFILWLDNNIMINNEYILKIYSKETNAKISKILFKKDVNTWEKIKDETLKMNDIARVRIDLSENIAYEFYEENKELGSFILIDKYSNFTSAAGIIVGNAQKIIYDDKYKKENIIKHPHKVSRVDREKIKKQKGCALWFTGLSGSGKSTIANELEYKLNQIGYHTYLLDGDNIRHGLNKDLGFSEIDRSENIRRIAEVSKLFVDAGIIVLTAFISPFEKDRNLAKEIISYDNFIEIFIDTSLDECIKRDPKSLYKKALCGEIKNFTGLDSPYEAPINPDIHINTLEESIKESVERITNYLMEKGFVN